MDGNSVSTGLRGAYQGLATSSYWISTGSMSTGNSGITFGAQKLWHACEGRERCAQLLQKGKNRFTVAKGLARGWCFKWQGSGETLHPCRSLEAIADIQIQAGSLEKGVGARVSSATKPTNLSLFPKRINVPHHGNRSISEVTLGRPLQGGFVPSAWCPCRNEACDFCSSLMKETVYSWWRNCLVSAP